MACNRRLRWQSQGLHFALKSKGKTTSDTKRAKLYKIKQEKTERPSDLRENRAESKERFGARQDSRALITILIKIVVAGSAPAKRTQHANADENANPEEQIHADARARVGSAVASADEDGDDLGNVPADGDDDLAAYDGEGQPGVGAGIIVAIVVVGRAMDGGDRADEADQGDAENEGEGA